MMHGNAKMLAFPVSEAETGRKRVGNARKRPETRILIWKRFGNVSLSSLSVVPLLLGGDQRDLSLVYFSRSSSARRRPRRQTQFGLQTDVPLLLGEDPNAKPSSYFRSTFLFYSEETQTPSLQTDVPLLLGGDPDPVLSVGRSSARVAHSSSCFGFLLLRVGQWDCKDRIKFLEDEYSFRCQCTGCSKMNFSDLVLNAFHCVKLNCSGIVLESSVINCEKEKLKHLPNIINTDSIVSLLQAEELNIDDINKAANDMQINSFYQLNPGYCLKCGSYRDLESSSVAANNCIRRLQNSIDSKNVSSTTLLGALSSLGVLRSTLHAYNRRIAEAEDNLAQAFCLVGELQPAMEHCKASIEILQKLYNRNHIVIGYELVKLSSIQLSLRDSGAVDSIDRLYQIFSCYYGSHTDVIFPDLQFLRKEGKAYFAKYQLT